MGGNGFRRGVGGIWVIPGPTSVYRLVAVVVLLLLLLLALLSLPVVTVVGIPLCRVIRCDCSCGSSC
jgi:hypothetical protein